MPLRWYDLASLATGVLLALVLSIASSGGAAMYNLRYNLGMLNTPEIHSELQETVELFNKRYVALFTSGGDMSHLSGMPAENLVKRRIVQDINIWTADGKILSHDKQGIEFLNVELLRSDMAFVDTRESWNFILRDRTTGSRTKSGKSVNIAVRYILRPDRGSWRVSDYLISSMEDGPSSYEIQ